MTYKYVKFNMYINIYKILNCSSFVPTGHSPHLVNKDSKVSLINDLFCKI